MMICYRIVLRAESIPSLLAFKKNKTKMKSVLSFLVCVLMVIADSMEVNSDQLESKILKGVLANDNHKYVVSLQLDGKHICSSGLFQEGYLLTTGQCAVHIDRSMEKKMRLGTAVLGDANLKEGKVINIIKIAYLPRFYTFYPMYTDTVCDIGIVKLADNVDYKSVQILPLLPEHPIYRISTKRAAVCGWGSVTKDNYEDYLIEPNEYSDNLHCMSVKILNYRICSPNISPGDFRRNMYCGKSKQLGQKTTSGDNGSPLTVVLNNNGNETKYIAGITLHRFETKEDIYLRFIRTNKLTKEIQKMIAQTESETPGHADSSKKIITKKRSKRPRHSHFVHSDIKNS